MQFQTPLIEARLIRRYKRFLADVRLPDGREVTAHCANPGAMTGLMDAGARVWLERNDNPARKLRFSWKLVELPAGDLACVDTALPNDLVAQALEQGAIDGLKGYDSIRREVRYGVNSRIDFLLRANGRRDTYVEVKAVTLSRQPGLAEFPDTTTERGAKHLRELCAMAADGHRAVMLYLVQRTDCVRFSIARDIDPVYAETFQSANSAGVESLCFRSDVTIGEIRLASAVEIMGL
ncbi:MAG: DNA/RNA nuclease SfsA [Paracoccaceae bacterium]